LASKQIETSDFRPMGNSRWGDIIDVFTSDVKKDVLSRYKVILLLDQVDLNHEMIGKLQYAMEGGAAVICAVGVLKPEHNDFTGAEMYPVLRVGSAWSFTGEDTINEPFRYLQAKLTTGRQLVATPDGHPLFVEKKYGKGRLISCMIPWFEGAANPLCNSAIQVFNKVISAAQPVKIDGLPIEFLSTKSASSCNVVLSNNSDQVWSGRIHASSVEKDFKTCNELIANQRLTSIISPDGTVYVQLDIPPYEIRVVSWSK